MAQHYMTPAERIKLEALYNHAKMPVAQIARELGFSRQTIYNELKRGAYLYTRHAWDTVRYSSTKAQQIHDYAQTGKGRPLKIGNHHDYAAFLERKILRDKYSPATALAEARKAGFAISVCTATLYSYISKGVFLKLTDKDLWEKPRQKKKGERPERRVAHKKLPSIEQRPMEINQRLEYGHWEMDLIIGKAGSSYVLMTLTERLTRRVFIFKLPDHKAKTIRGVFDRLEHTMPDFREQFKSITTDNGPEFLEYDLLVKSIFGGKRFDVFYCHSYSAWEKGSVENHNRMIRRFLPKGTDFTGIKTARIAEIQDWMNGYPRKILGWLSPQEAYNLHHQNQGNQRPLEVS